MRDEQDGRFVAAFADGLENDLFGFCIHRGKAVVQDEQWRLPQKCPGNGDALLLPAAEVNTAFTQNRFVAVFEPFDVVRNVRLDCCALDGCQVRLFVRQPKGDVPRDGIGEQEYVLRDVARQAAKSVQVPFGQRPPIEFDLS